MENSVGSQPHRDNTKNSDDDAWETIGGNRERASASNNADATQPNMNTSCTAAFLPNVEASIDIPQPTSRDSTMVETSTITADDIAKCLQDFPKTLKDATI